MTAPSATARQTPTGRRIPDGFTTKITFATKPSLGIWEVKVKPRGADGGPMIDITTMFNTAWRTFYPQSLKKGEDITIQAAIDPDAIDDLDSLVNLPTTVTVLLPDNTTEAAYAALIKWEPTEFSIGEFPMVNLTIGVMNYDTTANVEAGPVQAEAAGT